MYIVLIIMHGAIYATVSLFQHRSLLDNGCLLCEMLLTIYHHYVCSSQALLSCA